MTESRFQLHDRIDSLTGELKAAEEQDRLNADDLAAKEHASSLARQAKEKSEANITRIKQAIREAGQAYSEAVLALTGTEGAPVADEAAPAVEVEMPMPVQIANGVFDGEFEMPSAYEPTDSFTTGGTGDFPNAKFPNAIFNGVDRAFEEATQP